MDSAYMFGKTVFYKYSVDMTELGYEESDLEWMLDWLVENNTAGNCTTAGVRFLFEHVDMKVTHIYHDVATGEVLFEINVTAEDCQKFDLPYNHSV
jgi:hypothetical protein